MEGKLQSLCRESLTQSPVKRKSDLVSVEELEDERTTKQQKPDAPLEELDRSSQDDKKEGVNLNRNAVSKEKGKSISSAPDKGKGMMVVEEAGSDDEGYSSDDMDGSLDSDDDDEADFSDDPLSEIDVDNILPENLLRRRELVMMMMMTMIMEGNDEKDDDDYDDDDDDAEEENEEEGEEMKEESK